MQKTFWNGTAELSPIAEELNKLIPDEGTVKNPKSNPALEKFRKASNLYYEIFNNGGINGLRGAKPMFGMEASWLRNLLRYNMYDTIFAYTEPRIEEIVKAAAKEQGLL